MQIKVYKCQQHKINLNLNRDQETPHNKDTSILSRNIGDFPVTPSPC